jgi:ribosomal protein S27E
VTQSFKNSQKFYAIPHCKKMLETIYLGIGVIAAIYMFLEDKSSSVFMRAFMAFLVGFGWPYFVVAIPISEYIKNKKRKNPAKDTKFEDEKTIVNCEECGKKLRIPKGKLLDVKCPNCGKEWREQY